MALPTPWEGETRDEFVARAMEDEEMELEFPDRNQRREVCVFMFINQIDEI